MNKAEQLIKELQEATKLVDTTFIPSESGPCKIWMEGKDKWKAARDRREKAIDAILDYVPEPPISLNEDRMTQEHYHKELRDLEEEEQLYQKDIHLLKQSLEEMTMLIEKIYAEITNKNMDLLVLTNEHAAQIKKAKELLNNKPLHENKGL